MSTTAPPTPKRAQQQRGPTYVALTMPGLGPLMANEIQRSAGLRLADDAVGNDGCADLAFFDAGRVTDLLHKLRTAEDIFAVVGQAQSDGDPQRLVSRLITRDGLERALSIWSRWVGPLSASSTFRIIVRVLSERRFRRTSLRSVALAAVARHRPRWRVEDPAMLELWILEFRPSEFVAALRLSSREMRQRGGRREQRRAALRPAVASAMVQLAGDPAGRLLDPCCGSGTLVGEALERGWRALGSDIDPEALRVARHNHPGARFQQADVRALPHQADSVRGIVTNLPFGKQFQVQGGRKEWLMRAFAEFDRVVGSRGHVVVLLPPPLPPLPGSFDLRAQHPIRLLGLDTTIWEFTLR